MIFPAGMLLRFYGPQREQRVAQVIRAIGADNVAIVAPGKVRLLRDCELRLTGNVIPFQL